MPPKSGFWYYDSIRAFRVYFFLVLIGVGVYLSKVKLPSLNDLLGLYVSYRGSTLALIFLTAILFVVIKRMLAKFGSMRSYKYSFTNRNTEPQHLDFANRDDFVAALREYGEHKGYKPGWAYYRSKEVWPSN